MPKEVSELKNFVALFKTPSAAKTEGGDKKRKRAAAKNQPTNAFKNSKVRSYHRDYYLESRKGHQVQAQNCSQTHHFQDR